MSDSVFWNLVSMRQAREELPGRPSASTLNRWITIGVKGVRLRTVMVGGRRFVSRDDLDAFIAGTTAAANGESKTVRTPRKRERDIQRAERELAQFDRATKAKTRGQGQEYGQQKEDSYGRNA